MNDELLILIVVVLVVVGVVFTIVVTVVPIVLVFFYITRKRQLAKHLLENGVRGKAVVKTLSNTGLSINRIPQVAMQLEVTLPNIPTYTIEKRAAVPMIYYPRMQPGMTVDVSVDPERLTDQKYLGILFE